MFRQQTVELREFGDEVVWISPGQAAARVYVDPFGREPLNPARKTEAAAHARQRAKAVPQERPGTAAAGEALIVVRFAVMHEQANPLALLQAVIEITGHLEAGIIL